VHCSLAESIAVGKCIIVFNDTNDVTKMSIALFWTTVNTLNDECGREATEALAGAW